MSAFLFLTLLFLALPAFSNPACIVCTVAIGGSLSIAQYFGVDDCVVGVWTGAMMAIIGYWLIRFFEKRQWDFKFRDPLLMALSIASIGFIYLTHLTYSPIIIGVFYIDPFLFTNIVGALVFIGFMNLYAWMKMKNGGHAHFPFEKVVLPFVAVFITSLIFHYYPICNCAAEELTPLL